MNPGCDYGMNFLPGNYPDKNNEDAAAIF